MGETIEAPRICGSEHRKWELQREEGGWQTLSSSHRTGQGESSLVCSAEKGATSKKK